MKALPEARLNLWDRAVGYFRPDVARRNLRDRAMLNYAGAHKGARHDRDALRGASFPTTEVNDELSFDLPKLRDASHELVRNSPLAGGIVHTKVTSIVGSGLKPRPRIDREALGMTDEQADQWERNTLREFMMWATNPRYCDATAIQPFIGGLQDLALRSVFVSGDTAAILPVIKNTGPYGIKVQMIEGHRLSNPNWAMDTDTLKSGIETDARGAPIAYHFQDHHPGQLSGVAADKWTRVRAYGRDSGRQNVIHLFNRRRPGQLRGFPDLAPVIEPLKQLERMLDYELQAVVVSAAFTVFIETEDGLALDNVNSATYADERSAFYKGKDISLKGGSAVGLFPGDKVEFANPNRPNTAFDPFVQAVLRQVGVAVELPFEVLIKHFTSSYSAAQAAMLDAWRFFRQRRAWLAQHFCQPVYDTWLMEAVATGRISAPGFFDDPMRRHAYCGCAWVGEPMGHIDPLKSAKSNEIWVNMGVKTLEEVTTETTGGEWEANHRQSAKEHEARSEAGLLPEPPMAAGAENVPPDPDEEEDDEDGEELDAA